MSPDQLAIVSDWKRSQYPVQHLARQLGMSVEGLKFFLWRLSQAKEPPASPEETKADLERKHAEEAAAYAQQHFRKQVRL